MTITFIGAGNMGGALARGLMNGGALKPSQAQIVDKNSVVREQFGALGCNISPVDFGDAVVVAVKPWLVEQVAPQLREFKGAIISIAAGVTIERLRELTGSENIVRLMPNTAVERLSGISFIASSSADLAGWCSELFGVLGRVFVVEEKMFDACMVLGSCGLAFALRYARASAVGGVELGVRSDMGHQIMAQVLRGAADLLDTGVHPEELVDRITTPGGITIKGLNAMEDGGFTSSVISGIKGSLK